jgi:glucokinase
MSTAPANAAHAAASRGAASQGVVAYVLLADIGGTNARFALADVTAPSPLLDDSVRVYEVDDFPSLPDAALRYLQDIGSKAGGVQVKHAVIAVAGRVDGDEARITNFPWVISIPRTCQALQLDGMRLVNDFTAQSMAVLALRPGDVAAIGGATWDARRGERAWGRRGGARRGKRAGARAATTAPSP